jgi:hypothetical protein
LGVRGPRRRGLHPLPLLAGDARHRGDLAVAMTVNLPVWGRNCAALAEWARRNGVKNTKFMDLFAGPYDELEVLAEPISERYLDWGRYRFVARAIQRYELEFWRAVSGAGPPGI